jgi:hypothetical protein
LLYLALPRQLLVANHLGVDRDGDRVSALGLQSNLGYTALHLAALDCPSWGVREISFLLLLAYADYTAECYDGRTAIEIARDEKNQEFIDQYNKFTIEGEVADEVHAEKVGHSRHNLAAKYTYRMPDIPKRVRTKFSLPPPDTQSANLAPAVVQGSGGQAASGSRAHAGMRHTQRMPADTLVPEHELLPLVSHGDGMRGAQALKCMQFAITQAEKNAGRRIALVNTFDDTVEALDIKKFLI